MAGRGPRTRLATGIYEDTYGRTIIVSVQNRLHERRYPAGTPLDTLRRERRSWTQELAAEAPRRRSPRRRRGDTLEVEVERYLESIPADTDGRTKKRNQTTDLGHWVTALGPVAPETVTPQDVRRQMTLWLEAGRAPQTINHRRQALRSFYTWLHGKGGENPVAEVPRLETPAAEPRAIPLPIVRLIFAALGRRGRAAKGATRPTGSQAEARLLVQLTTGLPPAQLKRLDPHDVDRRRATVYIRPRRKGKGVRGCTLKLTPEAVQAFRLLAARKAWGAFQTRAVAKAFARAVARARRAYEADTRRPWPCPDNLRAYDLRHTFLTEAYRRTKDLQAVAELGLHRRFETTARYTQAAVTETAAAASKALEGVFGGLPALAPSLAVVTMRPKSLQKTGRPPAS